MWVYSVILALSRPVGTSRGLTKTRRPWLLGPECPTFNPEFGRE